MKCNCLNITFAIVSVVALCSLQAKAQIPLPLYEPLPASYTNTSNDSAQVPPGGTTLPGNRIGTAPTDVIWSIGGGLGNGNLIAIGGVAGLSYPGLYQTPGTIGMYIRTNATTANRTRGILIPTVSSGNLYASFLLNVLINPTNNRVFVKFDSATSGTGSATPQAGLWITANAQLGLSRGTTSPGIINSSSLTAGTHLIVLRYAFNPLDGDDELALWVDPGSLSTTEDNVPSPTLSLILGTPGSDLASISSFFIHHPQSGTPAPAPFAAFLDEFRIGTTWAHVTPTTALCTGASVANSPTNQTVSEGVGASLSVIAGGSSPTFQWQVSTNSGATWNNVSSGVGRTNSLYRTTPLSPADNGSQFRALVNVACDHSSATSGVAMITVTPAVPTPLGVVVDDRFNDFFYNNLPYSQSNSVWFAGVASSLDATSGISMIGTVPSSSVNWIGYFTDNSVTNLPVHLAVGRALKGTLTFKGNGIVTNGGSLRIGYFDYADGATRPTADGFGNNTGGQNVRGYMVEINYSTTFSGNPFILYARNNLAAGDIMGTTGDYASLGVGPGGLTGAQAFQEGVPYTLDFTIARQANASIQITTTITGGGTNWTVSQVDNTTIFEYPRFDCIAVRAASAASTANTFEFTRFLVQVVNAPPLPIPLSISGSPGSVRLAWTNSAFALQSAPTIFGMFTNVPAAASPYTVSPSSAQQFFRLIWTAQ